MNNCGSCIHGIRVKDEIRDGYSCDLVATGFDLVATGFRLYDDCIRLDHEHWESNDFISEEEMVL